MSLERLMSEPEYRALPHISYSKLSGLDNNPASLLSSGMDMTDPLIYGSAVDTLVFDGREEFDKKFTTITCRKPGYKALPIIEGLLKEVEDSLKLGDEVDPDISAYDSKLLEMGRAAEYGGANWGDDAILRNLKKEGEEYFETLVKSRGKLILSPEQYEYCINSVHTLQTHEFTKDYFNTSKEGVDVYFQFPIVWEYTTAQGTMIHCKSLLDILIIDHNEKIIKPIDLKTTGKSVLSFSHSFVEWKYYLQAAFYTEAVRYLSDKLYPELSDYKIDLFKFVVISSKNPLKPLAFQITEETLLAGQKGGVIKGTDVEVKGYEQLIVDMQWHYDTNNFQYPKHIYDSQGLLKLDIFNVKLKDGEEK